MSDMLKVIEPKSDQINAEDLLSQDMTITITSVQVRPGTEQPVSMRFEGSDKFFRPCKTVSRIIVAAWGPDTSQYAGRSITLYRDPAVKWAGMAVGGIRVKAISHIDQPLKLALAESKQNRKITVVQPLKVQARQQQPSQPETDPAVEKWVADHIGFVVGAQDLERLASVQASGKKRFDWLEGANPDAHARVKAAYDKRFAELSGGGFPDEPQTGRSDEQHGDQFPGDEPARITDELIQQEGN
jgi:hypothetical protein